MPIKKYMLHVDGKDHQVSVDNIDKYGIESYAKNYPGATIRMRDDQNGDYDIPLSDYQRAVNSGLRPFVTSFFKDELEKKADESGFEPDSVAYTKPVVPKESVQEPAENVRKVTESVQMPADSVDAPVIKEDITQGAAKPDTIVAEAPKQEYTPVVNDSVLDAWEKRLSPAFVPTASESAQKPEKTEKTESRAEEKSGVWNELASPSYQEYLNELVNEWSGAPTLYPKTRGEQLQKEAAERGAVVDKIWNEEMKGVVDGLIKEGEEKGIQALEEHARSVSGLGGLYSQAYGMAEPYSKYARETDSKKIIEGARQYLAEKNASSATDGEANGQPNLVQEQLLQKVYDYLVQKNVPKSSLEYILRSVASGSIMGQLMSMGDGKSYEQRQIEAGGLQRYTPTVGEEVGAMAASIATDLPVMSVTGGVGGLASNTLLKGATSRLMASGLSEAAAKGIATRAAQQTGMKWALRTASEAVNFGTLEGLGSVVGQAYQTGDVDLGKAATSFAKGSATGAVMGVFGVSNDKFRGMMERGLGEYTGRTLGYASSLGGRTAILTGSSVMGQYLEDPNFDINNVDWTKEVAHAGLMNLGFDILGAVKKYQAEKKSGIRMRDIEKLADKYKLSKEDIEELNRVGIMREDGKPLGKNAQQIAESIQGEKDIFKILSDSDVPLSVRNKLSYLMTGQGFDLAPNTAVSDVTGSEGNFVVETYNPVGQTNERHRFKTEKEANDYRLTMENETKHNLANMMEAMIDNAGKIYKSTLLFDMFAKMYGVSKEEVASAYSKKVNGEPISDKEKILADEISRAFDTMGNIGTNQYNTSTLKRNIERKYGKNEGWMDEVLKKDYHSENQSAFDEYLNGMQAVLQGRGKDVMEAGAESSAAKESTVNNIPLLEGSVAENTAPVEAATSRLALPGIVKNETTTAPTLTGETLKPANVTVREASRQSGAELYAEHDPVKMRQAVVREEVAFERLREVLSLEEIEALYNADDSRREDMLAAMEAKQRRRAEDYLAVADLTAGMNDALDAAHLPELEKAESSVVKMTSPQGQVIVVNLGKHGDSTHEYGVVVSGVGADGNLVSPEGQILVVPIESKNWTPDYSTFDESKTLSMRMEEARGDVSMLEPETVIESLLTDYQADERLLEAAPIQEGDVLALADGEGNTTHAQVVGRSLDGGWMVLEEGQTEPIGVSEAELQEMRNEAERLPILREYAEKDKAYEREQKELQRQAEREAQRIREAEEAARIAEEMKKPINRLAKYPEGHKKAGLPDYERSKPEDVREYLVETLGLEGAVKSIRSQRADLERQVAEQNEKTESIIRNIEEGDYLPDEAVAARELIQQEQDKAFELNKRLDFWKDVERITAGPSEEEIQQTVTRSAAHQKAERTKREVYKPSAEYRKMQQDLADNPTAIDVLNDLEPHTPEELAAQMISGGLRLMPNDETIGGAVLRGVRSMTGYKQNDTKRLNFLFATHANGGLSVEEFGEMLEMKAEAAGVRFDGKTYTEGVNALLNLLSEVETLGDINRYVERNRMREAKQIYDDEARESENYLERTLQEEYGMSYADYQKLQDAITSLVEIRANSTNNFFGSDAYVEFINNFAKPSITDNGQEGNDNAGIAGSGPEAGLDVASGNGESAKGNQEPAGSIRPVAEMAKDGQPGESGARGAAEERAADGNGNDVPVSVGQGAGVNEEYQRVIEETYKQMPHHAETVFATTEADIDRISGGLFGEDVLAEIKDCLNDKTTVAFFDKSMGMIFVFPHKHKSAKELVKSLWHENAHYFIERARIDDKDFKNKAALKVLKTNYPEAYRRLLRNYALTEVISEAFPTLVEEIINDKGVEALVKANIPGNEDADYLFYNFINFTNNGFGTLQYRPGRNSEETGGMGTVRGSRGTTGEVQPADGGSGQAESVSSIRERGGDGAGEGGGMAGKPELPSGHEGTESEAENGSTARGGELVSGTRGQSEERLSGTYTIEKRHHDQKGVDIFAVKFDERFDRDKFLELKDQAKQFGGYYSRFGKGGFIFKTEADAKKFADAVVGVEAPTASAIEQARAEVNTSPTQAQKEAGNYKMGHVKLDGYDITIENPKGSVRSGKDANGKSWSITMNNDYGYIRGTKAVDGDHIDVFLSDKPEEGRVFVVDQANPNGSFDESKVMYGFSSLDEAREAYLANYEAGWESRIMAITEVSKDEFKKWIDSSTRKTKAFSEYKSVKAADPISLPKEGDLLKNNQAGGDAVAVVRGANGNEYLVAYATDMEDAQNGLFMGERMVTKDEMAKMMADGSLAPIEKESNVKPTYDEQGRETIESQAGRARSEAAELASQTESGSLEDAPATGRGSGTGGNRPTESRSGSGKQEAVNGYRLGEKVTYKGKEATIFDFEQDGRPVLDVGLAPVLYEVANWSDIQKLPASVEQAASMADARKPAKKLERAERRHTHNKAKREKQKEQMADLFTQVDAMDEKLAREEEEIDSKLALLGEYKAGAKAPISEQMHTAAAKTLEKAGRKFAKNLAERLGGHVDGKELSRGITNIAPIGGDMVFRVWMDDAETQGVMLLINFDAVEDTKDFDKLVPKYGFWREISNKDISGVRNSNHNFTIDNVKDLESGAFMAKVADDMLKTLNPNIKEDGQRNQAENPSVGTEARQEAERTERGGNGGSVHGNNVPDTERGGRVSGRDGEQQPSVTSEVKRNTNNWSYGETHLDLPTGEIGKLKGNIDAIRTLKELEASGQPATAEQKQALLKFVGWGGLAEALNSEEYDEWQKRMRNGRQFGWGESLLSTAWSKKWGKHYDELRSLMTDEEWAQAQASTLNSHYTPEVVIRGLWEALEYMGFKGGSILEPAMGVGHILGFMPKSMSERSLISGFELDSIPGRIAKQLYPDANITVAGYETAFRPASKDAVVTNVPFGQTAPVDPALDKALRKKIGAAYNLHNYFIIKGLLELKPGGVGAFITSSATMDGRSTKAREYIAGMGVDLVGAIRLPNNTFKSNAGTEVTADILFFRKRLPGEQSNGVGFATMMQVGVGTYKGKDKKGNDTMLEVPLLVNEYFATHPEMMLGSVMTAHDAGSGGLYGGDNLTLVAKPGTDLSAELADAIGRLPENALAGGTVSANGKPGTNEATTQKDGTLSVKDGKVYVASKGELTEVASGTFKHNGKARSYADATKDYQAMKETLKELIKAEQTQAEDPTELRKKLNEQYDQFVEKYGQLNENKNLNVVMEEDPERFLPQALEKVTTVTNPTTGRRTKVVTKGDGILAKRVSQPMTEPTTAESLGDAIGISQAYRGRMDVKYIADMLGITPDEARERILEDRQAYVDPVTGDLVDRDAYLSGNIREKLDAARAAAELDARYESNVTDLEAAMPESIPFVDIFYKMGTPWIPTDVYEQFALDVVGIKDIKVKYVPTIDQFVVSGGYVNDYTKSGNFTTTRRDSIALFEDAINMRKPTIMKTVRVNGEEKAVKDEQATQEAIQAIMDMGDAFVQYIQEAKDMHNRLANIYNDRYNNYRLREYREPSFRGEDGQIHYPGSNNAITLRNHQVKAVQRCLQGCTLLAHQVGTGKTFTMITAAMEMRRLGLANKPMIVVQNATLQDFAADFMKLYPAAKILVPNETERSASQRKRLFNLIATGDFDAIIVPQSFLAFIPDDEGRKKALIQARVDEILSAAEQLEYTDKRLADKLKKEALSLQLSLSGEEEGKKKGKRVKEQAKKEESALVRETRKLDRKTDDVLTFEQMGVDALFIDEAHNYKKIGFTTKMQNVKGVDTGYSERANSLYLKVSYVQEKNGGRNVVLATGTPITNTMAEVWTMMRFVAPEILADYNIRTFDEFAATFGQVEPSLEQNSTGGFKIADRFKSYVNVPELVKAFRSHADVVLTTDVEEFKKNKNIPQLKDGRMTNHVIQKSDKLQEVMDVLIGALAEDEKKSGKEKTPGLPLVVFSKAKQAAIDLRLINPEYPDDPDSKTNKVVSEVMRIYKESTPDKGIQMIFCDSYQSPASEPAIDLFDYDPNVPQFNLYRDIKQKLVDAGIPKDEIVIVSEITNAERKKAVFEKARAGAVRVLIGGTEKMGVGVNVQDRMIALHHMDAPIRPMDFEQRNGRILRQGNMFAAMDKPVEVLTYGVEGTLDATAYERLRIKQEFINQMMKGDVSGRVMEEAGDDDPSGKTFSQMAAELSGDKTLQLLFVAENKMKKLEGLRRAHELKRESARKDVAFYKTAIVGKKRELKEAERMSEELAKKFPEGITKLTINGRPVKEKLNKALADMLEDYEKRYAMNRSVVFPRVELNDKGGLLVFGHSDGQLNYSMYVDKFQVVEAKPINTFTGVWLSVNSALANSGKRAEEIRQSIAGYEARVKGAESMMEKDFDKMDELKAARQEVKKLKEELAKKAEKPVPGAEEIKLAKKNLKSGEKPVSLPEEMAGDSEESLDRMDTAMQPYNEVVANGPEMVVALKGKDIENAMPNIGRVRYAAIVNEATRKDVQAMYVPWTRQIVMLPAHGTVKEMRDKRWHESFHFALDMVLPQGDRGRLMMERAASEVDKLCPALSEWVKDTYGDRSLSEEKVVHMLEDVISYMEDAGKVRGILGGLDFGSQYPVLNELANKVINYLTNNGHGKESNRNSGYDEGDQPANRRKDQDWENEEDFAAVRDGQRREEVNENRSKKNRQDLTTSSYSDSNDKNNPTRGTVLDSIESASRTNAPDITNHSKSDGAKVRISNEVAKENLKEIEFTPQEIAEMETPILRSKGSFKNLSEGEAWAKANLQGKSETNRFTGEEISIGKKAIGKMFHPKFTKTVGEQEHLKALMSVLDFIREGIPGEIHADTHGRDFNVMRLYNAIEIDGEVYRVKSTVKKVKQGDRYYTYELQEMELIEETQEASGLPRGTEHMPRLNSTNSITGAKLLEKVKKTNGNDFIFPENEDNLKLALRGKPRRKAGESLISYNRRLKEWQAEVEEAKRRRDVEEMNVENPLDTELNDLAMEMMNHPSPIRRPGESDADFNARQAEWADWYNNRLPEINQRMREIKDQLEAEKAAAREREMDRVDEHLYEGTTPEQRDSEGQLSDDEMREVREIFEEKLADMKISTDKEQIKRDIKQEIIERRRYIETSNLEDTFFVDKVKRVAGSKEVLKAIPDYIEGTYTGEVTTELVEAAKLVKDWFEEVYNLMAMEGVLYDAPQIQNYVTHIWDWKRTPKEAQERYANWVNTMRLRSPFTKHRVIPSYKEGIALGMVPKYDDITGILMEYGHYATETIANKRMLEFLRNFKVMVPGGKDNLPMEMDIIVPDSVKDPMYSRMNHTALDGYKVLTQIKPMITPVFGDQRIVDPSHLTPLVNKLVDGIWATSGLMKKIALSFSFFHHGALTETAIAMMKPHHAAKVIAKNLIWDVITKGNIPALNDKEAARDAVKHLVSLGASNDYVTADVNNLTTQLHKFLKDHNVHVAKEAAYVLDFLNKGSDKFLWDVVHDGFKIASYAKMAKEIRAKAEREGWSSTELEKSLDEAGHLVNDTFGGLHFDILGFSPKSVRMMRALLLSPDWTLATIRQALSPLGFGKLYGNEGFWKTIFAGENPVKMRKKYGRAFWVTAGIFFYALMNGLNAYFRAKDEEEMHQDAEDMRRVDPDYKSPYELAYPDGMKWYDYIMPGNTLGHQTHLFTGRYEDGTETYARWGKQFRELPELFFGRDGLSFPGPMIDKMAGKANPLLSTTFEFISGHSLSGWENEHMKDKKGWERDVARLYLLASKFVPYSMPTQEDKEWYWLDLIMPSSKGFSSGKAIGYFEKGIKSGDMNYISEVYKACVKNGVNPEKSFDAAKARIEAEAKSNMIEGVEDVQDATQKFDQSTDIKERKRLLKYIEQQTAAQDYNAISQEEMVQQAKDVINGEDVKVSANDFYLERATSEDVIEDYRMKKNAAGLKKYHQSYTELMMENPTAGRRMLEEKRKYLEGYAMTTKARGAINKIKKAMKEGRVEADQGMKEIRKLRKEYFKAMDDLK